MQAKCNFCQCLEWDNKFCCFSSLLSLSVQVYSFSETCDAHLDRQSQRCKRDAHRSWNEQRSEVFASVRSLLCCSIHHFVSRYFYMSRNSVNINLNVSSMKKIHFDDYCLQCLLTRLCAWLQEEDNSRLIVHEDDQRCFVFYILLVEISDVIWLIIFAL